MFLRNIQVIPEEIAVLFCFLFFWGSVKHLQISHLFPHRGGRKRALRSPIFGCLPLLTDGSYENTPKQRSEFSFSLPWLITPGKVWPPAVSTDPTIDASLAQPYNHLRTKLCSASFSCNAFISHCRSRLESCYWFPPDPGTLCFWRVECWHIRQKVLIFNLTFYLYCLSCAQLRTRK